MLALWVRLLGLPRIRVAMIEDGSERQVQVKQFLFQKHLYSRLMTNRLMEGSSCLGVTGLSTFLALAHWRLAGPRQLGTLSTILK